MPDAAGPVAAYLYTLSLDGPGVAWEYVRRNLGYQLSWQRHGQEDRPPIVCRYAEPWGLRFPGRSRARCAHGRAGVAA